MIKKENTQTMIYKIEGNNLIIYPEEIEKDIEDKLNIIILFDIISNLEAKIYYFLQENISFDKLRKIKKYFLYNIPHCVDVKFDKNHIIIILTRDFNLDAIKTEFNFIL